MKINELIFENDNVYDIRTKKPVSVSKTSPMKAFGSSELNIAYDMGVRLQEKPDYWEDLEDDPLDQLSTRRLITTLKKSGYLLPEYNASDIWHTDPRGPGARVASMPEEYMFIVNANGNKYLADRTGAQSYIRNWRKI